MNQVKRLPTSVLKEIELKNRARQLVNLPPIKVKVRACMTCGIHFESTGDRTCGCLNRSIGFMAGREII